VKPDELTPPLALPTADALELLRRGELTVEGRLVDSSNATFYCAVCADGVSAACVYKPVAGERPLWDFPDGTLAGREVAAFEVSAASGWDVVPPTVHRDGPVGPGMVQLWIAEDVSVDVVALLRRGTNEQLRRIAVFDALINNGDRKGGHLLPTAGGHIYGVDHGVTFNVEHKLRTVLWQWAGRPLSGEATETLRALDTELTGPLGARLAQLLAPREVRATARRLRDLLKSERHPVPSGDWPPVPWPPM
jgi:uncharacterized repeat protein (TIGR03843 family)